MLGNISYVVLSNPSAPPLKQHETGVSSEGFGLPRGHTHPSAARNRTVPSPVGIPHRQHLWHRCTCSPSRQSGAPRSPAGAPRRQINTYGQYTGREPAQARPMPSCAMLAPLRQLWCLRDSKTVRSGANTTPGGEVLGRRRGAPYTNKPCSLRRMPGVRPVMPPGALAAATGRCRNLDTASHGPDVVPPKAPILPKSRVRARPRSRPRAPADAQ